MKKNITRTMGIAAIITMISTTSYADNYLSENKLAVGLKVGTAGFGVEGRTPIIENLYGRLGVNYFHYNHALDKGSLNYKGKLTLLTVPLMLDYHPFEGSGFRLSAGIAYNDNKVTATAKPNKSVTLNNHTYTAAELGSVKATLTLGQKVVPVISLGYDSSFVRDSPWSFNAEAGFMYLGTSKVRVSANGVGASNQSLINDLNQDANKSLKQVKNYLRFFPVVSLGFKYNF